MPLLQRFLFVRLSFFLLFIFGLNAFSAAQSSSDLFIESIPIPRVYEPIQLFPNHGNGRTPGQTKNNFKDAELNKEAIKKMSDIYALQIKAMRAEINNKPLEAEKSILKALSLIKTLLKKYPDIKNSKRFAALYGAVYTEYRQFYGMSEPINKTVGNVLFIGSDIP